MRHRGPHTSQIIQMLHLYIVNEGHMLANIESNIYHDHVHLPQYNAYVVRNKVKSGIITVTAGYAVAESIDLLLDDPYFFDKLIMAIRKIGDISRTCQNPNPLRGQSLGTQQTAPNENEPCQLLL